MLNFTVKNLLNACQNGLHGFIVYRIDPTVHTSYDPEEDTETIYNVDRIGDIDAGTLESEVQDFEIYDGIIGIYI
jgi:hypothetical protein